MASGTPKLFVVGITGYIGGTVFNDIAKKHPEWQITASVRTDSQAKRVEEKLPTVKTVIADLDNDEVLSAESAKADIVINCAHADHSGAVKSIIKGLNQRSADRPPAYYIHTSGTGIFIDANDADGNSVEPRIRSDLHDLKEILNLPKTNFHVVVDDVVREGNSERVRTAIVAPPLIYGVGTGPDKIRSIQAPELVRESLKRGKAWVIGQGKAVWNNVHVQDLSNAFGLLVEQAAAENGGSVPWGPEALYFTENGDHSWYDLSKLVADVGYQKGYFKTKEIDSLTAEDIKREQPDNHYGTLLWGTNSRGKADRIRQLGWEPKEPSLFETIPELFDSEAKALGK